MCSVARIAHVAWLVALLFLSCTTRSPRHSSAASCKQLPCEYGAIVRGSVERKELALVFTGDEFADGGAVIQRVLKERDIQAAFFLTGNFYRNLAFEDIIQSLKTDGHYLGAHSDQHLLYCDWSNRDSLLVTKQEFAEDLEANYHEMERFGISKAEAPFYLPPYEWYNDSISHWTKEVGRQLINYTSGTLSHADYTTPEMSNYRSTQVIFQSVLDQEAGSDNGLNGFILLSHIGVSPKREDKFYNELDVLLDALGDRGYVFKRIDELLEN